ncbi:MAG: phosphatase PAP2 family protein [Bacteroidales bacterium]|nr:phosphatase PAP2 family protein [Bacteroidales bacterium]
MMASFAKYPLILLFAAAFVSCGTARVGTRDVETYLSKEQMPDLVKCLPAPPETSSMEFRYDITRYEWGKEQRRDLERAAMAAHDAIWSLDTVITTFAVPLGLKLSRKATPEIYEMMYKALSTIELIRLDPKAYYKRMRPFEYFKEPLLTPWEADLIAGEGSYPSGHTIRGWSAAMLLTELAPEAAEALFKRAWEYGESRVIAGAHWQSDIDASRLAASIGYARLQESPEFRTQMEKAKVEYKRLTK